jgi:hypothetical protein
MNAADKNQVVEFYNKLRTVDYASIGLIDTKQIQNLATVKNPAKYKTAMAIFHKAAHQASESDFVEMFETGDVPPLKLTPEEMELARGGFVMSAFCIGVAIGISLIALRN